VPDPLRSTIAYLRLWKICDVLLARTHDSARVFEVVPLDEGKILKDLQLLASSDLDWADEDLRSSINTVLELSGKQAKSDKEIAALAIFRETFQERALKYSADIEIALGGRAGL
jgi:hypothetical protein